ncbi:hypothetical protein ONZ51_g11430 [Trametes cubensis]|uniref:Uncharacterized protein n=1 Tax=Trametes cubensis TaxID=1111947 RepID=A0AAD7X5T6_9APHY|nr:hypothetical protein ONZ51_g11430 [Trametes cubensis]
MLLSQRRLRRRFAVFDAPQRDASLAISQHSDNSVDAVLVTDDHSFGGGESALAELKSSLEDVITNLDRAERRWDTRFQNIKQEMEQLVHRHEDLWKVITLQRHSAETHADRITRVEEGIAGAQTTMAELRNSVGTMFGRIKEHRLEARRVLADEAHAIYTAINDIQTRISRTDLDMTIMRSQRAVDRAQTERLGHTLAVLESTDSMLSRNLTRLERDVGELSERYFDNVHPDDGSLGDVLCFRTLETELSGAEWGEAVTRTLGASSDHHGHAHVSDAFQPAASPDMSSGVLFPDRMTSMQPEGTTQPTTPPETPLSHTRSDATSPLPTTPLPPNIQMLDSMATDTATRQVMLRDATSSMETPSSVTSTGDMLLDPTSPDAPSLNQMHLDMKISLIEDEAPLSDAESRGAISSDAAARPSQDVLRRFIQALIRYLQESHYYRTRLIGFNRHCPRPRPNDRSFPSSLLLCLALLASGLFFYAFLTSNAFRDDSKDAASQATIKAAIFESADLPLPFLIALSPSPPCLSLLVRHQPSSMASNSDAMLPNAPADVCVCSDCKRFTYKDKDGVAYRGVRQSAKTIKRHKLYDKRLEKHQAISAEVLGNTVLLATAGNLPTDIADGPLPAPPTTSEDATAEALDEKKSSNVQTTASAEPA